jgi:RNA polymerase sigma factor (sigma-70 family)
MPDEVRHTTQAAREVGTVDILRNWKIIVRAAHRLCGGNGADADDLTQEAIRKAVENVEQAAGFEQDRLRRWLLTLVRNAYFDRGRQSAAEKRALGIVELRVLTVESARSGQDRTEARELLRWALGELRRQHPTYYEAIHARLIHEKTTQECAFEAQITANNFCVRYKRALERLRWLIVEELARNAEHPAS